MGGVGGINRIFQPMFCSNASPIFINYFVCDSHVRETNAIFPLQKRQIPVSIWPPFIDCPDKSSILCHCNCFLIMLKLCLHFFSKFCYFFEIVLFENMPIKTKNTLGAFDN